NPRDAIAVSPPRPQPTPSQAVAETETPAPAIATAPPGGFGASTPPSPSPRVIGAAPIAQPPPANATAPSTPVAPPFIAVEPTPAPDSRLAVPSLPTTTSTGTVVPPTFAIEPEPVLMAAEASIAFGQPLPGASKAVEASPPPASGDRNLSPDILIASGTVLELRYTGSQPLTLDPNTRLNEVLILETEIRDPITNGVLAPAGSQLIGQFDNHAQNQQWVSQMLIVPTGQRVPFASTSEYLVGSPQVSGSRLALGTGIGALALTLLTGFSGVGLLGGAFLGATTVVGTSPQVVVIQPNQIIYAQVTQDIPRSMPIAAAPLAVAEWGTTPSTW
ncbi:MAG TPA: hypothetical protein IGR64_02130, partial [Leptolyngbyaceae cyanobacterium M65_K2018_010]|nr:hypothetical protein [Leptolyngbyaceae cyanobacterium M65_K2018_010]